MIDLHSHILPGIDDGARSLDIALGMAHQAVECGITHVACTPHIHKGYFDNSLSSIHLSFKQFEQEVQKADIPLTLSFAAEVRVSEQIPIWAQQGELPFLGTYNNKRVLLLEMPHSHIPQGIDVLIKWLLQQSILPLIAHPERNRELLSEPHKFAWLKKTGCMFQLTAGALTGRFGDKVEKFATFLMREKAFNVVASDTHDLTRRPNDMAEAFSIVEKFDSDLAINSFKRVPQTIVSGSHYL
ncbi:tyrosine-protein phosphatase [Alteromonas sp.]|uniref:tyrosine-protein phosphatase n=1 Tax=Alteromonas sp. TaxID=232 RepID=UPI00257BD4A5|nr:CpsB/CapC family capsule biosynthesis tyrosine phosphatase [Alteromonas sp.]NQY16996.1 histidinol-phosphatase [Alteromonas sp.]